MATTKSKKIDDSKKAKAISTYLRISPQKMRLVGDAIRRRPANDALAILSLMPQKGAKFAFKVLKSAVANAKQKGFDESRLFVCDVRADKGPTLKRVQPRSMGRADQKLRRTTHLTIAVAEGNRSVAPSKAVEEEENKEPKKKTVKG